MADKKFDFWEWFLGKPTQKKAPSKPPVNNFDSGLKANTVQMDDFPLPTADIDISEKLTEEKEAADEKPQASKVDAEKEFLKEFRQLTSRHRAWDIWCDFVVMSACAISNAVDHSKAHFDEREARYMKIIQKYDADEQRIFPSLFAWTVIALDENQEQDFLGKIFMSLNLGDNMKGQIFTPYHVCDLMAKVAVGENLVDQVKEKGYVTINDACCGAGATLIAGVNEAKRQLKKANLNFQNHVFVIAQDIDETVALMCYIQLSLLGIAGYVKVGNSLTEPIDNNEVYKNSWHFPMSFIDPWVTRMIIQRCKNMMKGEDDGSD